MLVLGRLRGEAIVITDGPDRIVVRITDFRQGVVRLGIDAPRHVIVDREEIDERKATNG